MQLLTLKPHFLREAALYRAHVRSGSLGRRLKALKTTQLFAFFFFPQVTAT